MRLTIRRRTILAAVLLVCAAAAAWRLVGVERTYAAIRLDDVAAHGQLTVVADWVDLPRFAGIARVARTDAFFIRGTLESRARRRINVRLGKNGHTAEAVCTFDRADEPCSFTVRLADRAEGPFEITLTTDGRSSSQIATFHPHSRLFVPLLDKIMSA